MFVVIGAGLAGLAAARTLHLAGRRVVVLEARERIGGRLWTSGALGAPVDLGASWIHGVYGNPVSDLVHRGGGRWVPTPHERIGAFEGGRVALGRRELLDERARFERLLGRAKDHASGIARDPSLAEALAAVTPSSRGDAEISMSARWLTMMMGASPRELSARCWDLDEEVPGPDGLLRDGYGPAVELLAEGLDIRLGHEVERIHYRPAEGMVPDGATGPDRGTVPHGVTVKGPWGSLRAQAAIVTLPLGVLRARPSLFDPALPPGKREALERLGMGLLNKIVLRFEERFWPAGFTYLGPRAPRDDELWGFLDLAELGWPPILVAFTASAHGRRLEREDDEQLVERARRTLTRMLGSPPPAPSGALVTRWHSDPFSRGAYSHLPPGATGADLDRLAEPAGALCFAGEHTHRRFLATAHGAYLSGLREAGRLLSAR